MRNTAEKLAGKAAVIQVNTEENPAMASRYGVRGIPVTMLLKGGRVIDQLAGNQSVEALLAWFYRNR